VSSRIEDARHEVIAASLNLAATEWGNGRQTAAHSMDLDYASDRLDNALRAYVEAVTAPPTPPTSTPEPKETT
jgi:hypothetical protein